jgi:hypothetical protein
MSNKTFTIKAPIVRTPDKTDWISIGRATQLGDGQILCSLTSIPVGWIRGGVEKGELTFYLFPKDG